MRADIIGLQGCRASGCEGSCTKLKKHWLHPIGQREVLKRGLHPIGQREVLKVFPPGGWAVPAGLAMITVLERRRLLG